MQAILSPRVYPVESAEAADILINPANLKLLEPFWGRECSVTEAAKVLGVKANTLLKQVRRLFASGLLEVSCEKPRRGRPVKLYRTVAEHFFVPYSSSTSSNLTEAMAHKEAYWEDRFRSNLVTVLDADLDGWGLEIFRNAAGHLTTLPVPEVGQPPSARASGDL
jgi:predicted transcriptional regulator